jgi:hypothetical protein
VITFRKIYCKPKTHISHTKTTVNQDLRTDLFKNRPFLVWPGLQVSPGKRISSMTVWKKEERNPGGVGGNADVFPGRPRSLNNLGLWGATPLGLADDNWG